MKTRTIIKNLLPKIFCLGCNQKDDGKVYSDGSYQAFYQDLRTKEYFCEYCLKGKPVKKIKDRIYFRNNQYLLKNKSVCAQCLSTEKKDGSLIQAWNKLYYCSECFNWNQEASESEVATCSRYTHSKINCYDYLTKKSCGKCSICSQRKKLSGVSSLALMTELYRAREDFNALVTWEDDGFIVRFQELMWELNEVAGKTPVQIEKLVRVDIFETKKISQRKFSRGT